MKTKLVDHFKEVTAGVDMLYSIPSTGLQHQGTYQCEIYSGPRPIVSLYYYLNGNKRCDWENVQYNDISIKTPIFIIEYR